jgi:hypothetical protein
MRSLAFLVLLASPARADTFGYLPETDFNEDMMIMKPAGHDRMIVARTQAEWTAAWQGTYGSGAAPDVDFERNMVIGVVGRDRSIYRVQIDNAAKPTQLEVHLQAKAVTRLAAHFIVTPRSALAVHFVYDEMVDGGLCGHTTGECIDSKDVTTVAAVARPIAKLVLREDAEHAVYAALTAADKKHLQETYTGTWKRIPNGWTKIAIERDAKAWTISYDDLRFEVEIATGAVKRH